MQHERLRIAITDDAATTGFRLLCRLIAIAGAEAVVVPRTVGEVHLKEVGLDDEAIAALRHKDATRPNDPRTAALLAEAEALHLSAIRQMMEGVDGIIFPGNRLDVPPHMYGESTVHPTTAQASHPLEARFETEWLMADYALNHRPMPVLGICGGMQLLHVFGGGKLVQHLPEHPDVQKHAVEHQTQLKDRAVDTTQLRAFEQSFEQYVAEGREPDFYPSHPIHITDKGCIFATIAGKCRPSQGENPVGIFSYHHQGAFPEHIGDAMKVTATAPDGVVEAIEHKSHPFCVGVQFHPENNVGNLALGLVKALVDYAAHMKTQATGNQPPEPYASWQQEQGKNR